MRKYREFFRVFFMAFICVLAVDALAQEEHKTDEPIEITADELEVLRGESKAIFTGKVEALQGEMKLNSDVMTVFYAEEKGEKDSADSGMGSSIERIKAEGNVFLSTPEETAQGKHGDYDLNSKVVKLNQDVVLTRGKNVVKGDYFVYNLETGRSKVWSDGAVSVGDSVEKGREKPQRVRSIFVPKKEGDAE